MDCRLVWSPEAADDLEAIADYIGRDSPAYARSVAAKILATVRTLPEFPHIGRVVPEIGDPAVRERLVFSYRLIYRVAPERNHARGLLLAVSDRLLDAPSRESAKGRSATQS